MENIANTETQWNRDKKDIHNKEEERSKRRHKHRKSRSKNNLSNVVKQELREMIQRIPGVPQPLEKATPRSYVDSPFADDIALVEIPKRFTIPHMKMYDGSADPEEHIA